MVRKFKHEGKVVYQKQVKKSSFRSLLVKLWRGPGCFGRCVVLHEIYVAFRLGAVWQSEDRAAQRWLFLFEDFKEDSFMFFAWQMAFKILLTLSMHTVPGITGTVFVIATSAADWISHLKFRPFIDELLDYALIVQSTCNFAAILVLSISSIFFYDVQEKIENLSAVSFALAVTGVISSLMASLMAIVSSLGPLRKLFASLKCGHTLGKISSKVFHKLSGKALQFSSQRAHDKLRSYYSKRGSVGQGPFRKQ